jgi:hypothetical protein
MAHKFSQLTEVGDTAALQVVGNTEHLFQIVVANKNTSVDYNVLGSVDGVNYFDLESSDVQKTANGTYYLSYSGLPLVFVKGSFRAEAGGTAVTLDITYQGSGN